MTKLNNKLLSVFLFFGIIAFGFFIYLFTRDELISTNKNKHTLVINNIKIIKNDYLDTGLVNAQRQMGEVMRIDENDKRPYQFLVTNQVDSLAHTKSRIFNLKTSEPPVVIDFYEASMPESTLNENYKIEIFNKEKKVEEFAVINFTTLFDLKNKKNYSTEKRDFKLVSTSKKVISFINCSID